MKKSAAQLKQEQRKNNVDMGRTVRFDRQLTPVESKLMSAYLKKIRSEKLEQL